MSVPVHVSCLLPVAEGDTILVDLWLPEKTAPLLEAAVAGLVPPADCSVSEWAESSIALSHRVSPRPGRLRLEPYQRQPLDAIKRNERVVLIWAAQTGKAIVLQCFLGWAIDQYPGPAMVVCPDRSFAARRSTKHLRPFIEDSPVLAAHLPGLVAGRWGSRISLPRASVALTPLSEARAMATTAPMPVSQHASVRESLVDMHGEGLNRWPVNGSANGSCLWLA